MAMGRPGRSKLIMLTILYPATVIESLGVDSVGETADDVLEYLRALGSAIDIPRQLIKFIAEYMHTWRAGTPDFSVDAYFDLEDSEAAVEDGQKELHVVDSYSMSVRPGLARLGFCPLRRPIKWRAEAGCSSAAGPGASSTGRRRCPMRAMSAPSRRVWPRRALTCTSLWSPSTASRTCSASGPAC
jgi:hypothetical protein